MTETEFERAVGDLVERALGGGLRTGQVCGTLIAHVAAVSSVQLDLDESTSHRMAEAAIEGMRVIATAARAAKGKAS